MRGAIFFFRDDQLTTQVRSTGRFSIRVARDEEPELDRILAAHRLGPFSDVHRTARVGLPVRSHARVARAAADAGARAPRVPAAIPPDALIDAVNTEIFALDRLRTFEAADLPQAQDAFLDFDEQVGRSLLPEILRLRRAAPAFAWRSSACSAGRGRMVRRSSPRRWRAISRRLKAYLEQRGAYFHDDRGDPDQPLVDVCRRRSPADATPGPATPSASRGSTRRFFQ